MADGIVLFFVLADLTKWLCSSGRLGDGHKSSQAMTAQ